ncbi:MAG TPA: BtaA family protein [Gemmatimonadaceae bacterium]|nr:BtaA family protein [Gemmatimonadaceae bacterium]
MRTEAESRADFRSLLRYAQCWEDADVLLGGLDVQPGDHCLSIASAGENSLSLLTRHPARVVAIDLNPAQLAALELRVAAFRELSHAELLELIGSRPSVRRAALYRRCRALLSSDARGFWDARSPAIERGIGDAGKFESYFRIFRRWVLPLVHRRDTVLALIAERSPAERTRFYDEQWDSASWRLLFRVFFSELLLGRLGRDPSFFRYADGSVATHLLARVRHALTELDPSRNPYLVWILTGAHGEVLPHALRAEHFDVIRGNLDRLEWRCQAVEEFAAGGHDAPIDRANLSDIFEYQSADGSRRLIERIAGIARPGARIAYWNMMVPRQGAALLPDRLRALPELSRRLHREDKAFFYRDFVVEEVVC